MKKNLSAIIAGASIAAIALTGCGQGSPSGAAATSTASGSKASGELTKIVVGVLPIAPSVAVEHGLENGTFEKHGLDVEFATSSSGAAMLPAVSTGDLDFAIGNPLSVMTAVDKGLDMKIVSGFAASKVTGDDINGVVVRADSGLSTFADLAGKTTAVNALKGPGDLTILESAAIDGGNPDDLKFSEMPFPDMEAQLERGNMDAIWMPEPFLSKALSDPENKLLGYPNQKAIPGLPDHGELHQRQLCPGKPRGCCGFQGCHDGDSCGRGSGPSRGQGNVAGIHEDGRQGCRGPEDGDLGRRIGAEQLVKLSELGSEYSFLSKVIDIPAMTVK